ncbi:MAG TPA: ATP-binding cassette domain-containing protein [Anaeromyxobacteraceae bacterium]|nr:ATP-binding cassette domain-containing protein [Anaeromyxobacteraceae bacterium]
MFELSGVTKRYPGGDGLGPVDLAVPAGRTLCVIGPSGSGKSTLLRLLLGLARADQGQVRFEGREVPGQDVLALRRRMGYVVQGGGLFPHLTAGGNAGLLARHLGWDEDRLAARLAELSRLVQLPPEALSRYPRQLSGGQAQRVSLMRALVLDPPVLLLDEPMGALDPVTRHDLRLDLRQAFARLGKTVVVVTHDLAEAVALGDRLLLLRDGRVAQQGTPAEVLASPADEFVARFVGAQRESLPGPGGAA